MSIPGSSFKREMMIKEKRARDKRKKHVEKECGTNHNMHTVKTGSHKEGSPIDTVSNRKHSFVVLKSLHKQEVNTKGNSKKKTYHCLVKEVIYKTMVSSSNGNPT